MSRIKVLRSIYNYAISKNVFKKEDNYPFGKRKYIIPSGSNKKKALTQNEVAQIYKYQPTPYSAEDKAKDFWMFSYLCNGKICFSLPYKKYNLYPSSTIL